MTTSTDTQKKSVLITGCTPGGIGFALAKEYHAKGLRVIASARRAEVLGELEKLGLETIQLDVKSLESIQAAERRVGVLLGGKLDILVNNAGKSYTIPATDATQEGIRDLFETNVYSVMLMCSTFAELLIAAEGKIVNIGSIAAIGPLPFGSVYNASKAALHAYGNTLRVEMQPFNVQVITIVTGGVKSNISQNTASIAPSSLFYPMADLFISKRKGRSQKGAQPTEEYARSVVRQTLVSHPRYWIWSGSSTWLVWLLETVLPRRLADFFWGRHFGLHTFKERLAAVKPKTS